MVTSDLERIPQALTLLNSDANSLLTSPVCRHVLQNETTTEPQGLRTDADIIEDSGTAATYIGKLVEAFPHFSLLQLINSYPEMAYGKKRAAGLIDERSIIIQQWEGIVLFRDETTFTARLYEGYQDFPVKRTEIEIQEVEDEQRKLISPGAPFYWMIGYRVRAGSRSRFSEISFRRLPTWTKKELEEAELAATKLDEEAGWADPSEAATS
jgi:hypothetical protein